MHGDLEKNLQRLVGRFTKQREARLWAQKAKMAEFQDRLDAYEKLSTKWLTGSIVPKLRILNKMFPKVTKGVVSREYDEAHLSFPTTKMFPASARFRILLSHDKGVKMVRVTAESLFLPELFKYEKEAVVETPLDQPRLDFVERFLDRQIQRFAQDCMKILEPSSPYQREKKVVDPVCDTALPPSEAADSLTLNKKTYFFCTRRCRERYQKTPNRYRRRR